jgi:hypothetical protein
MVGPQPTEDRLLMDLIKTNRRTEGETLTKKQYEKDGDYNPWQAANKFGSWKEAKTSAGVYREKQRDKEISDQELLEDLKQVHEDKQGYPSVADYKEEGCYSISTMYNRFGSFKTALGKVVNM